MASLVSRMVPKHQRNWGPARSGHSRSGKSEADGKTSSSPVFNSKTDLRSRTRARKGFLMFSALLFVIAIVFLILVEVGNTHIRPVLSSTYFFQIGLTNVVPRSAPNAPLVNSIARTLGLHDFYQVGLWNYCAGYNDEGVTTCSRPSRLYWFNPIEIIISELLAGATIALPAEITSVLEIVRKASHAMFGLFITGLVLIIVSLFVSWTSLYSRWMNLPNAILTFLAALTTTAASIVATIMFVIFRKVFTDAPNLNIRADLGAEMFAFMWIASGCSIIAWLIQMGQCCCCSSRRDVKKGTKGGRKTADEKGESGRGIRQRLRFSKREDQAL